MSRRLGVEARVKFFGRAAASEVVPLMNGSAFVVVCGTVKRTIVTVPSWAGMSGAKEKRFRVCCTPLWTKVTAKLDVIGGTG